MAIWERSKDESKDTANQRTSAQKGKAGSRHLGAINSQGTLVAKRPHGLLYCDTNVISF